MRGAFQNAAVGRRVEMRAFAQNAAPVCWTVAEKIDLGPARRRTWSWNPERPARWVGSTSRTSEYQNEAGIRSAAAAAAGTTVVGGRVGRLGGRAPRGPRGGGGGGGAVAGLGAARTVHRGAGSVL